LEELYNVPCVLRAFGRVQRRIPNAEMIVAHDGPLRAELERMAEEQGLRNIRFIGEVSQQEIGAVYDQADIYWTCPNFDCMPGSLLECFAAGIPVIGTRVGGIPYIITENETGLLVDADDDAAMAEHAFRLLDHEDLAERLTAAAAVELSRYRWAVVREQWLGVYQRLTAKG
jgi:glycosyltransferase involved in cell wall biosynthesis